LKLHIINIKTFIIPIHGGPKDVQQPDLSFEEIKCLEGPLLQAKAFCIKEISSCIQQDDSRSTTGVISSICQWLETFKPSAVVDLYFDLRRQLEICNGYVVETNELLSVATGSSSNAILLGSAQQSRCALFYAAPYICKSKVALEACLVALEAAQKHVEEFPSKAVEDTLTDKRYVQHMFAHVLNQLSCCMEVSDTQVALSLLNMGTEITSDSYKYIGAEYCVNFFDYHFHDLNTSGNGAEDDTSLVNDSCSIPPILNQVLEKTEPPVLDVLGGSASLSPDNSQLSDDGDDDFSGLPSPLTFDCGASPLDVLALTSHQTTDTAVKHKNFGPAAFYTQKPLCSDDDSIFSGDSEAEEEAPQKIPVHYPKHFWYHGKELRGLTIVEYFALVDILPLTRNTTDTPLDNNECALNTTAEADDPSGNVPGGRPRC
jgi:hypothetical protein